MLLHGISWLKYATEHLKKGSHVASRGHLEYREYETKSGEKRRTAEIHLDEIQRL